MMIDERKIHKIWISFFLVLKGFYNHMKKILNLQYSPNGDSWIGHFISWSRVLKST